MFTEADWLHSSPALAPKLSRVFVGLEFGWWHKKGSIVALDAQSGRKKWEYLVPAAVFSSPAYDESRNMVVCGASDGFAHALDAVTGTLLWKCEVGEVRARPAFNEKRDRIVLPSFDSNVYIVEASTGVTIHTVPLGGPSWSEPVVQGDAAYVTSLDKCVYCIDLSSGSIRWRFASRGRIFSAPLYADGRIYVGSNDARWYELDPATGKETGFFQAVERITSAAAYDPQMRRFFLPTFANEMYCLTRMDQAGQEGT